MDLFRCESATLRAHWVLVVMDRYTRRIIGFGVQAGKVDGVGLWTTADLENKLLDFTRPTLATIARIPHWKGERRIRRRHDQSQISVRFDGNLTVVTYIRHQWLHSFPKTLDRCVSGQPWENFQTKPSGVYVLGRCALRGSDRFSSTVSISRRHVLDMPEARPAQYAVVAQMTPSLKCVLGGLRYERLNPRWEIAEFDYRPSDWSQARRCIVPRKLIEATDPEPTLFILERYAYRAWHTNLPLTPAGVW